MMVFLVGGAAGWYLYLHKTQIETALEDRGVRLPFITQDNSPIRVMSPKTNAVIKSPLMITGEAKGTWFFEAVFPVRLLDGNGKEIAHGQARATSDWMTTDYVPFTAELTFTKPMTAQGILYFAKDNPSGLPQNDARIDVPVRFDTNTGISPQPTTAKRCVVSGCSNQICASEPLLATCEFRPEYACYKTAKCEVQANGQCGWTQTAELKSCLSGAQ